MSGLHLGSNFRRFGRGTLPPLALAVIMALPLIFGGLFVWSYYDPIGNLGRMPVALVNSDTGDAGGKVVDELADRQPLDFHLVSAEEARRGIADGTYYLGVEIPTDFTEAVTSVDSPEPHQAKINVTLSEANGFIPTLLGNQATTIMTSVIADSVSREVVNQLFVGINTLGDGLDQAADGARQVHDGAIQASDGGGQLKEGTGTLSNGAHELESGLGTLTEGTVKLDEGVSALKDGAGKLDGGIAEASQGADALADGMVELQGGTTMLGDGAARVAGGVDRITAVAPQLETAQSIYADITASVDRVVADLDAAGLTALADQARGVQSQLHSGELAAALTPDTLQQIYALKAGAHEIAHQLGDADAQYRAGVDKAAAGAKALSQGLSLLKDGSGTLVAGVATLKDGSSQLVVGARTAADGSSKLAAGSDQLVVGASALADGLVQLDSGSGELSMRLSDGASQAPRWQGERLDAAAGAAATPVAPERAGDDVTFFGKGLSPFFLSLALWFGGLALFMVFNPMPRRAIDSGTNPFRALLSTLLPAFVVGFGQALLLWLVQVFAIGVEPAHPGLMLASLVLTSWAFISAITAINIVFGPAPGRLITMALMSLQLVASNGLYPTEVQPRLIQWIHQVDPMRFSVDLLRQCLFGGQPGDPRAGIGVAVLVLLALVSWAVASAGLWRHRIIMAKDIHPELAI
ncbi:YhgE/Pip domain-containing protein [Corynebacterium liangguodongii]|uniref:YhgE/Pip domain-containing protein n=1 Tax=Corynebacterium liangguodongii TaxID=2079535 RepID=A0A2S0WGR2_9CORY|nr:YhgE/Pip domain-containing protein [Corynebacterium liangguodongii]PWB99410.1 YhgE/Pip domain-containing protein [Corynebacterium liangguodongii]